MKFAQLMTEVIVLKFSILLYHQLLLFCLNSQNRTHRIENYRRQNWGVWERDSKLRFSEVNDWDEMRLSLRERNVVAGLYLLLTSEILTFSPELFEWLCVGTLWVIFSLETFLLDILQQVIQLQLDITFKSLTWNIFHPTLPFLVYWSTSLYNKRVILLNIWCEI